MSVHLLSSTLVVHKSFVGSVLLVVRRGRSGEISTVHGSLLRSASRAIAIGCSPRKITLTTAFLLSDFRMRAAVLPQYVLASMAYGTALALDCSALPARTKFRPALGVLWT